MNYFYLKIFGLVLFIIAVSYWNTYCSSFIESFSLNSSNKNININENNDKTVVLLGDSILKNNSYVPDGKGVDNMLEERNAKVVSLAENNSKIVDVYGQINKIPLEFDSKSSFIFLSSGGNDILSFYVDQQKDPTDTSFLNTMLSEYEKLVKKQKQLVSLGFKNVYIYLGGMFEWLLLQDVYGQKEFPSDKKGEILDFK